MSYLLLSTISGQKIGALSYTDGNSIPDHFANGLPFETNGSLAVDVDGVISHYHQGLPFSADGRLVGTLSETPTRFGGGAAPFSAEGRLVFGSSGVTHYSGGICYTEAGSIGAVASSLPTCWLEPIAPCSTETQRYLWIMDGQDDFWLRAETWQCVDPVIEMSFIGYTPASTYILFDGDTSGTDRAFAFINANTGYLNCPSAQTLELNGVVVTPNTLAAKPVEGEENHIKITFTGNFRVGVVGCRFSRDTAFSLTPITAIKLTDPADAANTHTTKFVNNEAYQLELGGELGPDLLADKSPLASSGVRAILPAGSYGDSVRVINALGISWHDDVFVTAFTSNDEVVTVRSGGDGRLNLYNQGSVSFDLISSSAKAIPASTFLRENDEPDGSDIVDITRKPDNSGWTSENLIDASVFDSPAAVGSQWSKVGDEWRYVGDGSYNALRFLSDAEQPELFEIAFTVTGFTGSGAGTFVNTAASGQSFSANGDYLFTVTKSVSGTQAFKRFGGVCSFNISNVRLVLDYDYADGALPE